MKIIISFILLTLITIPLLFVSAAPDQNDKKQDLEDEIVTGTQQSDDIHSSGGDDNIHGLGGDDVIDSGSGDDLVSGDAGNDKINGGKGNDYIMGGEGNDVVKAGPGDDYVSLGPGDDILVFNLDENFGNIDFADGGEGFDTAVIVTKNLQELMDNDVLKYYDQQKLYGKNVVDLAGVNVNLGLKDFDKIVLAASYSF